MCINKVLAELHEVSRTRPTITVTLVDMVRRSASNLKKEGMLRTHLVSVIYEEKKEYID